MHETYTGGIGSFLLFCMLLAFLRHIRKENITMRNKNNLQSMLLSE
jgi:non-canonical poly(A) RNA polymerase PAPD5/7